MIYPAAFVLNTIPTTLLPTATPKETGINMLCFPLQLTSPFAFCQRPQRRSSVNSSLLARDTCPAQGLDETRRPAVEGFSFLLINPGY